ncbi:MAG: LuxR C-terminal-related transcriptional regulator [Acidimicrobiia bacterium]
MIRCVVGDRSIVYTQGLSAVLRASGGAAVVGHTSVPAEVPDLVGRLAPDVVVASFEPPAEAVALARRLGETPVLVLTWSRREDDLFDALRAGAMGFVHKEAEPAELLAALADVVAGKSVFPLGWERLLVSRLDGHRPGGGRRRDPVTLTRRERDIVQLIVDGHSNKALAAALGIAHQTAKNHLRHVMAKVAVSSRTQLCAWAIERGYVPTAAAATA